MKKHTIEDLSEIFEEDNKRKQLGFESQLTFQESKPLLQNLNQSQSACDHIKCWKTSTSNYKCQICNRLRNVCPFSRKIKHQEEVRIHTNASQNTHTFNTSLFQKSQLISSNPYKNMNEGSISNQNTKQNAIKFIKEVPQRVIVKPSPIIQEIIFYPVIHNQVYYASPSTNPEESRAQKESNKKSKERNSSNKKYRSSKKQEINQFIQQNSEVVLTPFQFEQLIHDLRQNR